MKQLELAHYREMLRDQAVEPSRRGIFTPRAKMVVVMPSARRAEARPAVSGPPPQRAGSLFGRRPAEQAEPTDAAEGAVQPLILSQPTEATQRLRLRATELDHQHLAETPYHAEDLADPPAPTGPSPGVIAGWSSVKPPSAQVRLLRRLGAVIEAERQGLAARLEVAGVAAA